MNATRRLIDAAKAVLKSGVHHHYLEGCPACRKHKADVFALSELLEAAEAEAGRMAELCDLLLSSGPEDLTCLLHKMVAATRLARKLKAVRSGHAPVVSRDAPIPLSVVPHCKRAP